MQISRPVPFANLLMRHQCPTQVDRVRQGEVKTAGLRTTRRLIHRKIIDGNVHLVVETWVPARYESQLNVRTNKCTEVHNLLKPGIGICALLRATDQRNAGGRPCVLNKDLQLIDQTAEHVVPKTQFRRRQGARSISGERISVVRTLLELVSVYMYEPEPEV